MNRERRGIGAVPLGALLLTIATASVQAWGASLYPQPGVYTAENAFGLANGDFNEDGIVDLVVGHRDGNTVAVLIGRGDGTFLPPASYPPTSDWSPIAVAVGDFNDDGHDDVAYGLECAGIGLRYGNGDGTFGPETPHGDPEVANQFIAVADFDGDERDDLIASGHSSFGCSSGVDPAVLLNNGDGSFTRFDISGGGYYLAVGDFDGDGLDDWATMGVSVYLSNGDGTFDLDGSFPGVDDPTGIAVGDLNADTILDLVVVGETDDLSVLIGNGDGSFQPAQAYSVGPANPVIDPRPVVISDLDGDGLGDVVVSRWFPDSTTYDNLWVLYGVGGGLLGLPVATDNLWAASGGMVVADFDDDGIPDVARTSWAYFGVTLLLGRGDGSFRRAHVTYPVGEGIRGVRTADLNADGRLDVVLANFDGNDVSVLLGNAAGTFAPEARFCLFDTPTCTGSGTTSVEIGEFTGDAHLDILATHQFSESVVVLEGDGAGGFTIGPQSSTASPSSPAAAAVGDFNQDGKLDAAVVGGSNRVSVLLGAGDGSFFMLPFPGPAVGTGPLDVKAGLIDDDAILDLAVLNGLSGSVSILLGLGNGTFGGALTVVTGADTKAMDLGDVNGDSISDMVVARDNAPDQEIRVYTGFGDGTFALAQTLTTFDWSGLNDVIVEDLDGDSLRDIAVLHGSLTSIFLGHGDGTFDGERQFIGFGTRVAAGDFDLDARLDLVRAGDQAMLLMLNQGGPSQLVFAADGQTLVWPATTGALSYDVYRGTGGALVDVDDDGLPDAGYGVCMTGLDPDARDTFFVDPEAPSTGAGFYYLMSVIDAGGDQGIGSTSAGLTRLPAEPCP